MHHRSQHDPRISISRDAFRFLEEFKIKNALILFISENSLNYRLSLITRELKMSGKAIRTEFTNPKRFSYLLGPGIKKHTVEQYLLNKERRIKDEEDLKSRFSVEIVNKEFYRNIAEQFSKLVGGSRKSGSTVREFSPVLKLPQTEDHTVRREFAVRLIGRIVFCWFLKKKRSAAGIPLIPEDVLSTEASENHPGYYHKILEPLFFEVMNRKPEERREEIKNSPLFQDIPFLNGGLFDHNIHQDFYEPYGSKSEQRYSYDLRIEDEWFKDFFTILELYNFTIDENTPVDIDISVDPEMLGRIFENLLAEINPETEETARKNTGSYYTPRPIVEYMVDESLKEYLLSRFADRDNYEQKIRDLLDYRIEDHAFSNEESKKISEALDELKVLDPACGSGAFPMGILQKMLLIRQKIDPESINWVIKQLEPIRDPALRKIMEDKLMTENWDYRYKMSAILHSIYGVDIQAIAVEIAKLRFFLTLIVEEKVDDNKPNRGIKPLPNLSFKFVAADSLLSISDYLSATELDWTDKFAYDECINKLEKLREEYFYADQADKKSHIQIEFRRIQNELSDHIIKSQSRNASAVKLANWNPFSDEVTDWFDPKWMFGLEGGFDIVIGNPPYIQLQSKAGKLADKYKNEGYATFCRTGDIYSLFYERGMNLLQQNGILCYITSNKWMRAKYGEATRNFFAQHQPLVLIDLGSNIFESATVDTNILLIKKNENTEQSLKALDISKEKKKENFISHPDWVEISHLSSDTWTISSPIAQRIKEKIEKLGKPLKEWDIGIYYGVKTGYNKAFIIDTAKREEILNRCRNNDERQRTDQLLKPILRGRDIKRYKAEWAGLWLIFIPWHFPLHEDSSIQGASEIAEREFQTSFPTVYQHLLQYKDPLAKRNTAETGIRYEWYALQRCAATYYREFDKDKIIYQEMVQYPTYCYDKGKKYYCLDTGRIITGKNLDYLLLLLNSNLFHFAVKAFYGGGGLGAKGLRMKHTFFNKFPAINMSEADQPTFINLANQIITDKDSGKNTDHLESQIDRMVFELYELTLEEISHVEEQTIRHNKNKNSC
jgi:23S rRNA G2445 N2-methylase RlmL